MIIGLSAIFPCDDIEKTASFYEDKLGFRAVKYLTVAEPHICLYKDDVEIILTRTAGTTSFKPNRVLYGYGYDAYFYTKNQEKLAQTFEAAGVNFVRPLSTTDYGNTEFVIEDCDGRHLAFGCKNS